MNLESVLASLFGWPFFILALGIYSITRLITIDSLVDRQREWLFDHFPPQGRTQRKRPNGDRCSFIVTGDHYYVTEGHWLGELFSCPWCMGFWVSTAVFGAFILWPVAVTFALVPFAFRVIPGVIESIIN